MASLVNQIRGRIAICMYVGMSVCWLPASIPGMGRRCLRRRRLAFQGQTSGVCGPKRHRTLKEVKGLLQEDYHRYHSAHFHIFVDGLTYSLTFNGPGLWSVNAVYTNLPCCKIAPSDPQGQSGSKSSLIPRDCCIMMESSLHLCHLSSNPSSPLVFLLRMPIILPQKILLSSMIFCILSGF